MHKAILCFGDSIANGQGVSVSHAWPSLLGRSLHSRGVKVFVSAVNGETSREGLERFVRAVSGIHERPLHVIVQYGINDANLWESHGGRSRVGLDSFRANLHEYVGLVEALSLGSITLMASHYVDKEFSGSLVKVSGWENLREIQFEYNRSVELIAREASAFFIDQSEFPPGLGKSGFLMPDGVHLSETGHRAYLDRVVKHLFSHRIVDSGGSTRTPPEI